MVTHVFEASDVLSASYPSQN